MSSPKDADASSPRKRGRPSKFGRPSRVVAVTLPEDVVRGLQKIQPDLGWAIVSLFEKAPPRDADAKGAATHAELATIAGRRRLIVVNQTAFKSLPGISIIPLHGNRAFLALELGRGMADMELAVSDRLRDRSVGRRERKALMAFLAQLRTWRRDRSLRFHTRSIIVVERVARRRRSA